jgi:polygalacturonase
VHHNTISDVVSGPGMRFNTTFARAGYDFSGNGTMQVYENTLRRTGTLSGYVPYEAYGAINLVTTHGDVRNIVFKDMLIDDVMNNGIYVNNQTWGSGGMFRNITFDTVHMVRVPTGTWVRSTAIGTVTYKNVRVTLDPMRGEKILQNDSKKFTIR